MTDHDVQLLLADLALIIVLARVFGAAAKRIGQPPVLGEIVAGIMLGPTIWSGHITTALFPKTLIPPLTALADLGLVFFMFVVGYEVDLGLVHGRERVAVGVALGSILAPLGLGAVLGAWLAHRYHVTNMAVFVFFVGTAMSITAFPVLARILTDRGLHRTMIGGLALASASIDDVLAWALLAIVFAIAGSGGNGLRIVLAPVYAALVVWVVRPLLRRLGDVYQRQRRLTPAVLAVIIAGLLLSSAATDWMGVKFIFGAFIFGMVMPRDATALREDILARLEQVSVLVLLPVFFVIAGINVNLSGIGLSGLVDLCLIMAVAVVGKFGGAYLGGRLTGVRPRQAGALAALMNTRGLTEIVILAIGLQLGILDKSLYSLMVAMAILTTAMAGPLLKYIYPSRIMQRDIAEADRELGGRAAAHRTVVLIDSPEEAAPLIDVGSQLVASRSNSELVLSHLVAHRPESDLDGGSGIGGDLLQMTQTMSQLRRLAERAKASGVSTIVQSRFSDDVPGELPGYLAAAGPDTIVLGHGGPSSAALSAGGTTQLVTVLAPLPPAPTAVVARWSRGPDGAAVVQVAARIAVARGLGLVLTPTGRPCAALAADLTKRGVPATAGTPPEGAVVVTAATGAAAGPTASGVAGTGDEAARPVGGDGAGTAHLAVLAGSNEFSDDLDQWVQALEGAGSMKAGSRE
ncbi:MAG TPA: cation:proton antiporter [Streptosporangiaceae bacterium]|nr:cation:proton antiporter [Streptosporangiaceae bacterium]